MGITARSLIIGLATYIPSVRKLSGRRTGGTSSARYCYSVWLRHLSFLRRSGLPTTFETIVELGPGDSLGIGLAALLSGAERYIALDAVRYADCARNLQIFEELIALLRERTPIPDETEFPLIQPRLPSYVFPAATFPSALLNAALESTRLDAIRASIRNPSAELRKDALVCYIAPWSPTALETGTVDLVFSQTVLEYPRDLAGLYAEMVRWLRRDGVVSHEIDFKSIGVTKEWNGHWTCPDTLWRLAMGKRRHRLNREPHSTHVALLEKMGCRVVCDERTVQASKITRAQLAPRFRHLTDEDLTTSSALIQAKKVA
jgi:hypothetical protein